MEIKLNKSLQKKLNDFLETKDEKLLDFLKILKMEKFTFLKEEINNIEQKYKSNNYLKEYVYIYRRGDYKKSRRFLVYREI